VWAEMLMVLREHWPEYLMEAAELAMFMVSACVFATILGHPTSPLAEALPHPTLQRLLMGIAMGLTAVGIIYSPWGQQSGGNLNPAVTLTFLLLRIYFIAPPLGRLAAAEVYDRQKGAHAVLCAKLHHHNNKRSIFRCGYEARAAATSRACTLHALQAVPTAEPARKPRTYIVDS
jgi:hypothetical protein